jgi:hypothetical protein
LPSPSHSYRFDHPKNIWWGVQIMKCGVRSVLLNICYMEFCVWLVEKIVACCR